VEQLASELAGRAKLVKVNVDTAPRVQGRSGVQGIPILLVLQDGREVGRKVGAAPLADGRGWSRPLRDLRLSRPSVSSPGGRATGGGAASPCPP
jgi:hypothetical protein